MNKDRFITLCLMIFAAAASRLLPHEPNFTPVAAIALFAGASFSNRWLAFLVPAVALLLSDLIIGFYPGMWVNYLAFAAVVCIGFLIQKRQRFMTVLTASVAGAVVFFVISNFSAWFGGGLYPMTVAGLQQALVGGLPFFKNTLLSDLWFTALLFGGLFFAERTYPSLRDDKPVTA